MYLQRTFAMVFLALVWFAPTSTTAAALAGPVQASDVKANLPQPYIVKKGDTLWDIANYFFKDPHRWLKIWERNLYITNPDLIYPGNEIWFDHKKQETGGLRLARARPQARSKPVERLEAEVDTRLLLTALARQDFITPEAVQGTGYILDSVDERINYGANDRLYVKLLADASEGDVFDVFRAGDPVRDPRTGKDIGVLINHLGQVEITGSSDGIYRAIVLNAFEEISRGDKLKPASQIDTRILPSYPQGPVAGEILYIRAGAAEAGQSQIVGVSLGLKDGMQPGTVLSVHRAGRKVADHISGERLQLPEEKIGELLILVPQQDASIALVKQSTAPINLGDTVRNLAKR